MREGDDSGARIGGTGFKPGAAQPKDVSLGITFGSTPCELSRSRVPGGRTGIGGEVIRHIRRRRDRGSTRCDSWTASHIDLHPPGSVRLGSNAEELAVGILEHPVAAESSGGGGCGHFHSEVCRSSYRDVFSECQRCRCTHLFAAIEDELIRSLCPCTRTDVLETPSFCKLLARRHVGAIRDSHIGDELGFVTCRGWNGCRSGGFRRCGGGRRTRYHRSDRGRARSCNDRIPPERTITHRGTPGGNVENEPHALPCQGAQVEVRIIRPALMFFSEGPKGSDRIPNLIIKAICHITGSCIQLAAHSGPEPVSILYSELRIDRLDISICDLLGRKEQARLGESFSVLKSGVFESQRKAFGIIICAGEGEPTRAARPGRRLCIGIGGKLVDDTAGGRAADVDLYPPGPVSIYADPEQHTVRVLELPVANIMARCIRRRHIDRKVNVLAGCDIVWHGDRRC